METKLTQGEKFILDWQFGVLGSFIEHLAKAMEYADNSNLTKLSLGFPDEVEAYRKYTSEPGWWSALQAKAKRLKYFYD